MPIYAYRCENCGHAKDVLRRISDPVLTDCPACGKSTFRKQVTAAGFQLKGSGWYVTDFKGDKKPASKGDGAAAGGEKGDAPTANGADASPAPASAAKGEGPAPVAAPVAGTSAKASGAAKGDSAAASASAAPAPAAPSGAKSG